MTSPSLHPAIDNGIQAGSKDFAGGYLHCHCDAKSVQITVTSQSAHNHVCGCSQCWKPEGALFSQVAVVPKESLSVTAYADKLEIVDKSADSAPRLQKLRCAYVRSHRESGPSVLWP